MSFERDPGKLYPHDHILRYTLLPLIPKFVTPNSLTIFRFCGTPVVIFLLLRGFYGWGFAAFILLALTDALDGSLARVRGQITRWGTIYDPIADKLLIGSVILFIVIQHINPIFGLVVIGLEALIIAGAYWQHRHGRFASANIFGKTKMFLQVLGVALTLLAVWLGYDLFIPFSVGALSLAMLFAVISLFTYGF